MARLRAWDEAMAARLRAGDDSALSAAYDQYSALVHGIATTLVGRDRAGDVTQEVFLSLWQRPEVFDPAKGSLRTFLAVVARRRAIDELRRNSRRETREAHDEPGDPATVPNVEEAALAMIAADRVRGAIGRLPAEQRRAVELAYFDGLTYKEVAKATGSPEGTAKSRLRLALGHLAAELADEASRPGRQRWV